MQIAGAVAPLSRSTASTRGDRGPSPRRCGVDFRYAWRATKLLRAASQPVHRRKIDASETRSGAARRAAHARLRQLQLMTISGAWPGLATSEAVKFTDQQLRLIDLRRDQNAAALDLKRHWLPLNSTETPSQFSSSETSKAGRSASPQA